MFKLAIHFVVASLAIASALGGAVGSGTSWHEKRLDALPEGYVSVSPAPSDASITLRIALAQRDFSGLEKALYKASTPGTAEYGNWLSKSQVESYIRPSDSAISAVQSWLSSHGLASSSLSPAGDWITVNTTVSQAYKLLSAEFTTFRNIDGEGSEFIRALEYSVPDEVKEFVRTVHPTIALPVTTSHLNHTTDRHISPPSSGADQTSSHNITRRDDPAPVPSSCIPDPADPGGWVAPYSLNCRFAYYGIPKELPAAAAGNSLWISGFAHEFVHRAKVQAYLTKYRPDLGPVPFDVVSIDGGVNNQLPTYTTAPPNVMMFIAASTAHNVPLTFMTVGTDASFDTIDWLLSQADYLLSMEDPPKVVVIGESTAERRIPRALAETLCAAYAQLSARGVTLVHAQLLAGVDPRPSWEYEWPADQRECPDGFDVSFPASCPYVTSVGGSLIDPWATNPVQEAAVSTADPSNGGWSNVFPRPAYQDADVNGYLGALGDKNQGMFDPAGRATPDIAAFASLEDSSRGGAFGENPSYSAALFASMIAIINGERIASGMSTMGFVNPWIYANKGAFNDITKGSNPGCFTDGFSAGEGWDPVTGVGSPMFARLRSAAGLD